MRRTEGRIIILQSFTTADARRSVLRRAENLARRTDEQAIFIAIHTPENAEEAEKFADRSRIPVALDTTGRFCDDMGFWKTPAAVVIDRSGTIRMAGANVLQAARFVPRSTKEAKDGEAPGVAGPRRAGREEGQARGQARGRGGAVPGAAGQRRERSATRRAGAGAEVHHRGAGDRQQGRDGRVLGDVVRPLHRRHPAHQLAAEGVPGRSGGGGSLRRGRGQGQRFRSDRRRPKFEYTIAIDPQRA